MSLRKEKSAILMVLFLVLVLVQIGTIRRKDDPMTKAQADPILFKEKMEQEKDGKKEAPMPSFTLYGKQRFLADSPVGTVPPADDTELDGRVGDGGETADSALEAVPEDAASDTQVVPSAENEQEKSSETSSEEETSKQEEDWWSEEAPPQ